MNDASACGRARARGWVLAGPCLLLCVSPAAPAVAACQPPWLTLGLGVEHSRWEETGATGRRLVKETGTLRGPALALGARCDGFDGLVRVTQARGSRDYEGLTSSQVPARTRTDIGQWAAELQGFVPLGAAWAGAGRAGLRGVDREIASVGRVQGYAERFSNAELAAGARYATEQGAPVQWTAIGWLGAGPPGRLELQLPGGDEAELRLGASRSVEFELQAQGKALAPGSSWQARLTYRRERWEAGESQVITRQGVPVAAAMQPATRQSALRLHAEWRFDF